MEWLLKITEGPMKGAEIALVNGTRVKVGRAEECDIVLADAALDAEAFELDVSEGGVTLIAPGDVVRALKPFEVHAFGTTSIAVGPVAGVWEALREPTPEAPAEDSSSEAAQDGSEAAGGEAASTEETDSTSAETPAAAAEKPARHHGKGCLLAALVVLLVVMGLLFAAWFLRARLVERFPVCGPWVERLESCLKAKSAAAVPAETPPSPAEISRAALKELAKQHGLVFSEKAGVPVLTGDLAHRTERMAIRALALAADCHCILDLSDAETLARSADALLFAVTEGAVTVDDVKKRTVALKGYAPDAIALAEVFKAVKDDVPWVKELTSKRVRVGGPVPAELARNVFANTGRLVQRPATQAVAKASDTPKPAADAGKPAAAKGASDAGKPTASKPETAPVPAPADPESVQAAAIVQVAEASGGRVPTELLPVAGILVKPYACVVLQNGHRLVEGAKISGLTIVEISAAGVGLEFEGRRVRWEP